MGKDRRYSLRRLREREILESETLTKMSECVDVAN